MKKILGYLFYVLAAILSLGVISQLGTIIKSVLQLKTSFNNEFDGYQFGYALGHLIGLALYSFFIVVLFKYANKWTTKTTDKTP